MAGWIIYAVVLVLVAGAFWFRNALAWFVDKDR
jgi:hypothetical protein